jgi:two-component sensor histidine kinase
MTAVDETAMLAHAELGNFTSKPAIASVPGIASVPAIASVIEAADEVDPLSSMEIDLRQLRHHTKNTLQRLLGLIAETKDLSATPAGEKLARELEHRIRMSAAVSDAIFGLTDSPGSMVERLRMLCGAMVDLMQKGDQVIRVGVSVRGHCPVTLREAVVRAANELVGNAVKHGLKNRASGRIVVRLHSDAARTVLSVTDNGWGFHGTVRPGEGLAIARSFADRHHGTLVLDGTDGTQALLTLPHGDAPAEAHYPAVA